MKPAKRFQAWCYACDTRMVAGGEKCPNCFNRQPLKRSRLSERVKVIAPLKIDDQGIPPGTPIPYRDITI